MMLMSHLYQLSKTARTVRINIIRKMLCFSLVGVVSRGVGVGEVDEMHVDGTRGCAGAVAVQKDFE